MPKASNFVEVVKLFERNIQRSFAPSLVLFVMLGVAEIAFCILPKGFSVPYAQVRLDGWIALFGGEGVGLGLAIVIFLFTLVGTSYALSALHQILFDNMLMNCFEPWLWPVETGEAKALRSLRAAVVQRLSEEKEVNKLMKWAKANKDEADKDEANKNEVYKNDFILYEVLGGIDPTPTYDYVDRSKSLGVFFVSMMVVTPLVLLRIAESWPWCATFTAVFLALLILWYVGLEGVKSQYRSRALRLYVNFLMLPEKGIDHQLRKKFGPPGESPEAGNPDPPG